MYHYTYNLGMVDLLVLLLIFSVGHIYVCDGVATKMAIRGANHDAVGRGYSNVECFTGKTEILDVDIVQERREATTLKKGGKGLIVGYNISSSMGRSKNHYYSRKLLFFNEPVFAVHYRSVSSSLVSTSLTTTARHMSFSKVLSSFIFATATAPAPSHSPSPSMEPPIYPPPKINHRRRRGHPPNPPLIPFLNPSAAPHDRVRHRRPHGRHHHRNRTAPVAPGPSPMHGNVSSPHLPPHHNHMKPPWVAISPAHGPIPPKSREKPPPALPPMNSLPSPPPNEECGNTCIAPYTETLLGSPCGCVRPVKVKLELGVALYMLFPQISMLAEEIAESVLLSQSQVRVVGANADSQDQSKSIVDIDLVPLGDSFDNITVLLIFQKVWNHEVSLNATVFGNYSVIFVHYPGLPPSPPEAGGVGGPEGSMEQPFGTNVKRKHRQLHKGTVILIALSSVIAVVMLVMAVWLLLLKCNSYTKQATVELPIKTPSIAKRTGSMFSSDKGSSTTLSFVSSMAAYTGSAKTFTLSELERATDNFKLQNIVGEGGFGRVYSGVLDDGAKVAVKVLTRDDQQGRKEFIAEVEMLSRLHHRNLVRLIGFCTEDHARCLVYELVPNGSVESHLHGVDKEASPLDWDARMRIALGAARALAYLHEDSNPRVIHRDFKASNILLEDDFTPKVSDFGLAKAAPDQGSGHISTRVMGTFGYVAPEYAMTGHLLVKSDVYSYGVVMLELLTGRKPVDMSQIGQENLVTWARPLLSTREGLEILVDPALGTLFPFENMAKVAAIASMCVHPEVSHRPFMGEVVQALKLVCNEGEASNGGITSANASQTAESPSRENSNSAQSERILSTRYLPENVSFISVEDYDSGSFYTGDIMQRDRPRSASAILSTSGRLLSRLSGSFRRHSSSGPLRISRKWAARYKVRGGGGPNYHGSMSEHTMASHFRSGFGRRTHESSS